MHFNLSTYRQLRTPTQTIIHIHHDVTALFTRSHMLQDEVRTNLTELRWTQLISLKLELVSNLDNEWSSSSQLPFNDIYTLLFDFYVIYSEDFNWRTHNLIYDNRNEDHELR